MLDNPFNKNYDIYMSNFSDYKWFQSTYNPATSTGVINLGGFSSAYTASDLSTTITPAALLGHLFQLKEFSFGTTYANNTKSYRSVKNDQSNLGSNINMSSLGLNFRGIGLPTESFKKFENLLEIISNGEATCLRHLGGYCVLPKSCD